jgi:hypothetical protein
MQPQINKKILIIIPAYNEEATLGAVIDDVHKALPEATVLVVNDGSSDNTSVVAKKHGATLLTHTFNMGIGATVQTGYKYALLYNYDIAVQVDADGQHPPEQIAHIIAPLLEGRAHVVIGSRFLGQGDYKPSLARSVGIAIFSRIVSIILSEKITDTTSGFRAVDKKAIKFLEGCYPEDYPEVEALVLLHKKRFAIMEVPVTMAERKGGKSSITTGKSAYYMVKVLLAIMVDLIKKV